MSVVKPRPLTKFDYWQLPEAGPRYQLDQKRVVYARAGVSELWIVDPDRLEVQVFDLRRDPDVPAATLRRNDALHSQFLPGFELALATVFQRF
jgi:Uma2 family endonuclease